MLEQSEKNKEFFEAINKAALEKSTALEEELKEYMREEMDKAAEEASVRCHQLINEETQKIKLHTSSVLAEYESEKKSILCKQRSGIRKRVFQNAKETILAFSNGKDYPALLQKSAQAAGRAMDADDVCIHCRPQDAALQESIRQAFGRPCTFASDAQNQLGGLKFVSQSKKLILDDTLETRLRQQVQWFRETAQLPISGGENA